MEPQPHGLADPQAASKEDGEQGGVAGSVLVGVGVLVAFRVAVGVAVGKRTVIVPSLVVLHRDRAVVSRQAEWRSGRICEGHAGQRGE